jgi:hypothetical protein
MSISVEGARPALRIKPNNCIPERLDEYWALVVDDRLLERNYAARFKISKSAPYRVEWICCIHENESSNDCVYDRCEFDFPKIACYKMNVCEAAGLSALLGVFDLGGIVPKSSVTKCAPCGATACQCYRKIFRPDPSLSHSPTPYRTPFVSLRFAQLNFTSFGSAREGARAGPSRSLGRG